MDPRKNIEQNSIHNLLKVAYLLADESRSIICSKLATNFNVLTKADKTLVTDIDMEVEQRLRSLICELCPNHGIVGEEFPDVNADSPFTWFLDPIDGTEEFINGIPTFGTLIGLQYQNLPILGIIDHPALNIRASGAFGFGTLCQDKKVTLSMNSSSLSTAQQRVAISKRSNFLRISDEGRQFDILSKHNPNLRIFDTCYSHTCAINGSLDAVVEYNVKAWDLCAIQVLIEEAGGKYVCVRKSNGPDGKMNYCAVFGKAEVVDYLLKILNIG